MDRHAIVTLPSRVLRRKSRSVGKITPEIRQLAKDMMAATLDWEAHRDKETGVALAAVQIGILQRVVVVRKSFSKENKTSEFKTYLNPEIIERSGEIIEHPEGCLSVKDVYGLVPRYSHIKVRAKTLTGKPVEFTANNFLARVFQHEIDHTNGKLYIDRVKERRFHKIAADGKLRPLTEAEMRKYHL